MIQYSIIVIPLKFSSRRLGRSTRAAQFSWNNTKADELFKLDVIDFVKLKDDGLADCIDDVHTFFIIVDI